MREQKDTACENCGCEFGSGDFASEPQFPASCVWCWREVYTESFKRNHALDQRALARDGGADAE